jgi:hypothetical protein
MYLSLRLTTKVRACKVAGGKWSPRVTFYTFGNVGKCEGMNSHALKWAPTSGVKVSMDSWIFIEQLQGSRLIGLKSSLYHWKSLKTYMFKMGLYNPFGYLKHKLWPKEGLGIKLPISLPITKSQKSPWFTCAHVAFHILLKRSQQGLQLCFKPHLNRRFAQEIISLQSRESLNFGNFKTPKLGISRQNDIWVQALWLGT